MIEFVFRPKRLKNGKRVISPFFCGRYSLRRGIPSVTVALETTDEQVARKRLREIVAEKQREAEGIVSPSTVRTAAAVPLVQLVEEYRLDLVGRDLAPAHVKESIGRINRMVRETGWVLLHDIRPDGFTKWRALLDRSAKTKKEFQTSINAFLNWLVRNERLLSNPLAKVDRVDTRGKAVRVSRSFRQEELQDLCRVAPTHRRLVYLFLAYTGARKNEARSLRWMDLDLGAQATVVFRAENTKSGTKRVVPLRPELAQLLRDFAKTCPESAALVFPRFPSEDALHADFARAGIQRKDAAGRVVHFHAFRKTFQTWGAVAGVGQRSAQELLGHSDPSLTATVYTDIAALALHDEVAKLPWILPTAQTNAQDPVRSVVSSGFRSLLSEIISKAQTALSEVQSGISTSARMAARHGFEP